MNKTMTKTSKWTIGTALLILTLGLLLLAVSARRAAGDRNDKTAASAPALVSIEDGETVVTLDAQTQARLGLLIAPLQPVTTHAELTALGIVLPVDQLSTLRTGFINARMALQKARVNADVTQKEYERLRTLYQDNQNASQKAVQAAEGAWRLDQADLLAAQQQLALQSTAARLRWGNVVAGWLAHDLPSLARLLTLRAVLVQVTPSSAEFPRPPRTVLLQMPNATTVRANLVSPFTQVNPQIQGMSFLYITAANPGLVPGMSLVASVPTGKTMHGVLVPRAAVVWFQGEAWVYLQTAPGQFTRREVSTSTPLKNGWFAGAPFAAGDKVVVRGAQMLLSEESRPQTSSGGDDDD
ncbi:MAG TPA: hypothetical protein VNF02_05095 [Candidatus Limnocylindrales bacterium]|nr:hypothetical protein [Candidatus Limnocylindrales bacterium]